MPFQTPFSLFRTKGWPPSSLIHLRPPRGKRRVQTVFGPRLGKLGVGDEWNMVKVNSLRLARAYVVLTHWGANRKCMGYSCLGESFECGRNIEWYITFHYISGQGVRYLC